MSSEQIVIIGAGPAGCAAAVQCRRLGASIRLLDRSGRAGGLITNGFMVENYPGLESPLPGEVFAARLQEHLERFAISVQRAKVKSVQPDEDVWLVETDQGTVRCRSAILATGTTPKQPPLFAHAGIRERLFTEVRKLLAVIPVPSQVAVIGGGEAAFDYALSLARAGASVAILVRGEAPRATGRLRELVECTPAIKIECGIRARSVLSVDRQVTLDLETRSGPQQRTADAVLAAVGRVRNLPGLNGDLIENVIRHELAVAKGLYVCGDARLASVGQAGIAVGDGLAAAAMATEHATSSRSNEAMS